MHRRALCSWPAYSESSGQRLRMPVSSAPRVEIDAGVDQNIIIIGISAFSQLLNRDLASRYSFQARPCAPLSE